MIRTLFGKTPKVPDSAFVAQSAEVIGDVELGEESTIWPGAVLRADEGPIRLGKRSHVQDNSVIHSGSEGLTIGDQVNIGHSVVLHCLSIGSHVLIGNNATVLDDVEIGDYCVVAAGAVVVPRTKVPDYSFVLGVPAEIRQGISEERRMELETSGDFYGDKAKEYKEAGI